MKSIKFESVSKRYNTRPVVRDFSLDVGEGERVVIFGPSGCGKTTVLRLAAGLVVPDSGRILIGGRLVAAEGRNIVPPEERQVGMVFQDLALWPHLTVRGNLEFGLKAQGVPRPQRQQRIENMLRLTRMDSYRDAKPAQLSGGEQQRVALARALVLQPQVLLMDEPLSSLDHELGVALRQEILWLHDDLRFTLLYVTHDHEEAAQIGTRVVRLEHGQIVSNAPNPPACE
jgi:iron(III) transport system ATP-binding protein